MRWMITPATTWFPAPRCSIIPLSATIYTTLTLQKLLSMNGAPTPDADPKNYGGQELDFLLGTSFTIGRFSFGVEGGIPIYENVNGLQLQTNWLLTVAGQVMF